MADRGRKRTEPAPVPSGRVTRSQEAAALFQTPPTVPLRRSARLIQPSSSPVPSSVPSGPQSIPRARTSAGRRSEQSASRTRRPVTGSVGRSDAPALAKPIVPVYRHGGPNLVLQRPKIVQSEYHILTREERDHFVDVAKDRLTPAELTVLRTTLEGTSEEGISDTVDTFLKSVKESVEWKNAELRSNSSPLGRSTSAQSESESMEWNDKEKAAIFKALILSNSCQPFECESVFNQLKNPATIWTPRLTSIKEKLADMWCKKRAIPTGRDSDEGDQQPSKFAKLSEPDEVLDLDVLKALTKDDKAELLRQSISSLSKTEYVQLYSCLYSSFDKQDEFMPSVRDVLKNVIQKLEGDSAKASMLQSSRSSVDEPATPSPTGLIGTEVTAGSDDDGAENADKTLSIDEHVDTEMTEVGSVTPTRDMVVQIGAEVFEKRPGLLEMGVLKSISDTDKEQMFQLSKPTLSQAECDQLHSCLFDAFDKQDELLPNVRDIIQCIIDDTKSESGCTANPETPVGESPMHDIVEQPTTEGNMAVSNSGGFSPNEIVTEEPAKNDVEPAEKIIDADAQNGALVDTVAKSQDGSGALPIVEKKDTKASVSSEAESSDSDEVEDEDLDDYNFWIKCRDATCIPKSEEDDDPTYDREDDSDSSSDNSDDLSDIDMEDKVDCRSLSKGYVELASGQHDPAKLNKDQKKNWTNMLWASAYHEDHNNICGDNGDVQCTVEEFMNARNVHWTIPGNKLTEIEDYSRESSPEPMTTRSDASQPVPVSKASVYVPTGNHDDAEYFRGLPDRKQDQLGPLHDYNAAMEYHNRQILRAQRVVDQYLQEHGKVAKDKMAYTTTATIDACRRYRRCDARDDEPDDKFEYHTVLTIGRNKRSNIWNDMQKIRRRKAYLVPLAQAVRDRFKCEEAFSATIVKESSGFDGVSIPVSQLRHLPFDLLDRPIDQAQVKSRYEILRLKGPDAFKEMVKVTIRKEHYEAAGGDWVDLTVNKVFNPNATAYLLTRNHLIAAVKLLQRNFPAQWGNVSVMAVVYPDISQFVIRLLASEDNRQNYAFVPYHGGTFVLHNRDVHYPNVYRDYVTRPPTTAAVKKAVKSAIPFERLNPALPRPISFLPSEKQPGKSFMTRAKEYLSAHDPWTKDNGNDFLRYFPISCWAQEKDSLYRRVFSAMGSNIENMPAGVIRVGDRSAECFFPPSYADKMATYLAAKNKLTGKPELFLDAEIELLDETMDYERVAEFFDKSPTKESLAHLGIILESDADDQEDAPAEPENNVPPVGNADAANAVQQLPEQPQLPEPPQLQQLPQLPEPPQPEINAEAEVQRISKARKRTAIRDDIVFVDEGAFVPHFAEQSLPRGSPDDMSIMSDDSEREHFERAAYLDRQREIMKDNWTIRGSGFSVPARTFEPVVYMCPVTMSECGRTAGFYRLTPEIEDGVRQPAVLINYWDPVGNIMKPVDYSTNSTPPTAIPERRFKVYLWELSLFSKEQVEKCDDLRNYLSKEVDRPEDRLYDYVVVKTDPMMLKFEDSLLHRARMMMIVKPFIETGYKTGLSQMSGAGLADKQQMIKVSLWDMENWAQGEAERWQNRLDEEFMIKAADDNEALQRQQQLVEPVSAGAGSESGMITEDEDEANKSTPPSGQNVLQ